MVTYCMQRLQYPVGCQATILDYSPIDQRTVNMNNIMTTKHMQKGDTLLCLSPPTPLLWSPLQRYSVIKVVKFDKMQLFSATIAEKHVLILCKLEDNNFLSKFGKVYESIWQWQKL